jgi:hypothetical protein
VPVSTAAQSNALSLLYKWTDTLHGLHSRVYIREGANTVRRNFGYGGARLSFGAARAPPTRLPEAFTFFSAAAVSCSPRFSRDRPAAGTLIGELGTGTGRPLKLRLGS